MKLLSRKISSYRPKSPRRERVLRLYEKTIYRRETIIKLKLEELGLRGDWTYDIEDEGVLVIHRETGRVFELFRDYKSYHLRPKVQVGRVSSDGKI